jgi:hypothetical protein
MIDVIEVVSFMMLASSKVPFIAKVAPIAKMPPIGKAVSITIMTKIVKVMMEVAEETERREAHVKR